MKQMYIDEANILATDKKSMKKLDLHKFKSYDWMVNYEDAVELYVKGLDFLEALKYIKTIERFTYFKVEKDSTDLKLKWNDYELALVKYKIKLPLLTHSKNEKDVKIKLNVEYLFEILKEYPKDSFRKQDMKVSLKQGFNSMDVKLLLKEEYPAKIQVMGDIYILAPCIDND